MHEGFHGLVSAGVSVLTLIAASVLILGFVVSTVGWAKQAYEDGTDAAYRTYRHKLGRTVLLGLELLLAATILKTIVVPMTIESMTLILATIAIRTALGWATSLEVYGRWPWQKTKKGQ